jgi:hypothetical protein
LLCGDGGTGSRSDAEARRDDGGDCDDGGGRRGAHPHAAPTDSPGSGALRLVRGGDRAETALLGDAGEQRRLDLIATRGGELGQGEVCGVHVLFMSLRGDRAAQSCADAGQTIANDTVRDSERFGGGAVGVALLGAQAEDLLVEGRERPHLGDDPFRQRGIHDLLLHIDRRGRVSSSASEVWRRSRCSRRIRFAAWKRQIVTSHGRSDSPARSSPGSFRHAARNVSCSTSSASTVVPTRECASQYTGRA